MSQVAPRGEHGDDAGTAVRHTSGLAGKERLQFLDEPGIFAVELVGLPAFEPHAARPAGPVFELEREVERGEPVGPAAVRHRLAEPVQDALGVGFRVTRNVPAVRVAAKAGALRRGKAPAPFVAFDQSER